jgi:hypothetical protein
MGLSAVKLVNISGPRNQGFVLLVVASALASLVMPGEGMVMISERKGKGKHAEV